MPKTGVYACAHALMLIGFFSAHNAQDVTSCYSCTNNDRSCVSGSQADLTQLYSKPCPNLETSVGTTFSKCVVIVVTKTGSAYGTQGAGVYFKRGCSYLEEIIQESATAAFEFKTNVTSQMHTQNCYTNLCNSYIPTLPKKDFGFDVNWPDATTADPRTTTRVASTARAEVITNGPSGITNGPGGITNGPGGITNGPGGITNGPGGITNGPGGITNGPVGFTNGPGGITNGPGGITNGPVGFTNGPGGITNGPGGITDGSGGITIGPGDKAADLGGNSTQSTGSGGSKGVLIGGIAGGIAVVILLLILVAYCICTKRSKSKRKRSLDEEEGDSSESIGVKGSESIGLKNSASSGAR